MRRLHFRLIGLLVGAGVVAWRLSGQPFPDFLGGDSDHGYAQADSSAPLQGGAGPQSIDEVAALLAQIAEGRTGSGNGPSIQSLEPLIACLEETDGDPAACQSVAEQTIVAQEAAQVTVNRGGNGPDAGGVTVIRPRN